MSIHDAFDAIVNDATPAKGVYLTLYHTEQWYGGPEEGGWYGTTTKVVKYKQFSTREAAEAVYEQVHDLAEKLTEDAKQEHDRAMLAECEWCDRRGIDPADHPAGEPDGPDNFTVHIEEELGSLEHSSDPYYS